MSKKKKKKGVLHKHIHTPQIYVFIFAWEVRHESTVTDPIAIILAKDPEWPTGFPISLLSPLHGCSSVHAGPSTIAVNWGRVCTILASCPSARVLCLCCCHWIQWRLKWHKETALLVATVVSGFGRAILFSSHGQDWLMSWGQGWDRDKSFSLLCRTQLEPDSLNQTQHYKYCIHM